MEVEGGKVGKAVDVVVKKIDVPVPPESMDTLVRLFEQGMTDKTRLILVSHPVNFTGQFFPIKHICEIAHQRGIEAARGRLGDNGVEGVAGADGATVP